MCVCVCVWVCVCVCVCVSERERVEKGSKIATISMGLLARVVWHSTMYFMPLQTGWTGNSLCSRSYPVLVDQSCLEYLVPQTP